MISIFLVVVDQEIIDMELTSGKFKIFFFRIVVDKIHLKSLNAFKALRCVL